MKSTPLNKVFEDFNNLAMDEKEYAVDVITRQFVEFKRERIARRAKEAMTNLKKGMVKKGSVKDLLEDLDND